MTFAAPGAKTVHVLLCTNRGYYRHAAVVAVSLAAATRASVKIHIVTTEDCSDLAAGLAKSLEPYPHVRLECHRVAAERIAGAFTDRYVTGEAYLRFLAPEILPDSVERVVYLDCDVVVLGDVAELAAAPLEGKAVGAVPEWNWRGPDVERRMAGLGIEPGHTYVNSGVLVLDLARWRRDGITERLLEKVAELGSRLVYFDQDALNTALQGDIALMDARWNIQPLTLGRFARAADPEGAARAGEARLNPGVIHYTTADKPWKHRVAVRDRALYFRFLARTAWRGARPDLPSTRERLEYDLARSLLSAGIDIYRIGLATRTLAGRLGRLLPGAARERRVAR